MTKLRDTQLFVLAAACQRPNRVAVPLPASLKGGAAQKVVGALLGKRLLEEVTAPAGEPAWRTDEDGRRVMLVATDLALQVLGITAEDDGGRHVSPPAQGTAGEAAQRAARSEGRDAGAQEPGADSHAHGPHRDGRVRNCRADSKQAGLIAMLQRPDGASTDEIVAATGWQPHTIRGAIAGALKKRLGLTVASEKVEGRGRVYAIKT